MVGRRGLERSLLTMAQEKADGQAPGKGQTREKKIKLCSAAAACSAPLQLNSLLVMAAPVRLASLLRAVQRYRAAAYLLLGPPGESTTGRDRPLLGHSLHIL